jgi:hypothetical protein
MTLPAHQRDGALALHSLRFRLSPATATTLLAAAFFPMAFGHGGHHEENKIPEGATISPEPLVRATLAMED